MSLTHSLAQICTKQKTSVITGSQHISNMITSSMM